MATGQARPDVDHRRRAGRDERLRRNQVEVELVDHRDVSDLEPGGDATGCFGRVGPRLVGSNGTHGTDDAG